MRTVKVLRRPLSVALADLASRTAGLLLIEFRPASVADAYVEYVAALGGGRRAPTCTGDAALSLEDFENELLIHFHGKASAKPAHPPRAHTHTQAHCALRVAHGCACTQ